MTYEEAWNKRKRYLNMLRSFFRTLIAYCSWESSIYRPLKSECRRLWVDIQVKRIDLCVCVCVHISISLLNKYFQWDNVNSLIFLWDSIPELPNFLYLKFFFFLCSIVFTFSMPFHLWCTLYLIVANCWPLNFDSFKIINVHELAHMPYKRYKRKGAVLCWDIRLIAC